jgi:hypothetical protein
MAALAFDSPSAPEGAGPPRGPVLRWLDTLATWQMRHSYCVINRNQMLKATMTGVTQPSSANERSSINPCDR